MKSLDVAPMWDTIVYNAGFIVIKPTPLGTQLYLLIRQMTQAANSPDDQVCLNRALGILKKRNSTFRMHVLNRHSFLSGAAYFERGGRLLPKASDCDPSRHANCPVVVHNNWIVTKNAKVYRFREHLMWMYDGSDNYYSSKTRNYLVYTNPKVPEATAARQLETLKAALAIGHLLTRVVILPRFYCRSNTQECPLNSLVRISRIDAYFKGQFRESSFLRHPKVPDAVTRDVQDAEAELLKLRTAASSDLQIASSQLLRMFGSINARVLNVGSLFRVQVTFDDKSEAEAFGITLQEGIRRARYRQF